MPLFGRREPKTPRAKFRAGTRALARGRFDDAITLLRDASDADPDNIVALLNLGIAYHRTGQHTKAIEHFETVISLKPDEPRAYLNLAAAHNALGHLDKSEQALMQALEIDPRQAGIHYNLAVIQLKRDNIASAMAEMELELSVNPGHSETRAALKALRQRLLPH